MFNQKEHNDKVVAEIATNPDIINDKLWRMNNLYFIITKEGTKDLFSMNRAQAHFFDNYLNLPIPQQFHRHIILKSRQLGFTTFINIYILDEILFNTNKEGIIIAHKVEDAKEFFDRKIDFAVRNMDEEVKDAFFKINRSSARKLQIIKDYGPEEGATSSITVGTSGRSGTFHYVHISEFAKLCVMYPERAKEVETGTFPAVPFDGFIFIESTAEGMAGRFYEMFHENWLKRLEITPMTSKVKFLPHFYNWQYDDAEMKKITEIVPTSKMEVCEIDWTSYQQENNLTDLEITYYYMKWLQLGGLGGTDSVRKLHQEYPTTPEEAFLSTGQSYFPNAKVASMAARTERGKRGELIQNEKGDLTFSPVSNGLLEIFKEPEKGRRYIIGGDTSEGLAHGDAQVLYVVDAATEDCVALYSSQVPPDEFAGDAFNVGKYYNWALLAVEANKDGLWVNNELEKKGYGNIYYRKVFDDITQKIQKYYGWKTTAATRPFALAALKAVFLKKDGGFPLQLLQEMMTFVRNAKGKPEALAGKHDDVIIAASIALAVLQDNVQIIESGQKEEISHMKVAFGEQELGNAGFMLSY